MKEHDYSFDVLRIIGIFCVLFNHQYCYSCVNTYNGFSILYVTKLSLSILAKIGPPIFFTVSGALLLGKDEKYSFIFKHRILRILILMLVCSILVMLKGHDFRNPIDVFFNQCNWYLYAYIGYLIMLPLLRKVTKNVTVNEAIAFLLFTFVIQTISGICLYARISPVFLKYLQFFTANRASAIWNIIYTISGYCLMVIYKSKPNKQFLVFLISASTISFLLGNIFIILSLKFELGIDPALFREFFVFAPTLLVFYLVKQKNYDIIKNSDFPHGQ